jgi:hypothetical protein
MVGDLIKYATKRRFIRIAAAGLRAEHHFRTDPNISMFPPIATPAIQHDESQAVAVIQ